jgi:hypothetical protein
MSVAIGMSNFAWQKQKCVLQIFPRTESSLRMSGPWREEESNARLGRLAHNLRGEQKTGETFLIWIRCNPLKSLDSDE